MENVNPWMRFVYVAIVTALVLTIVAGALVTTGPADKFERVINPHTHNGPEPVERPTGGHHAIEYAGVSINVSSGGGQDSSYLQNNDHYLVACDGTKNGEPTIAKGFDHRYGIGYTYRTWDYYNGGDGCTGDGKGYDLDGHSTWTNGQGADYSPHGN